MDMFKFLLFEGTVFFLAGILYLAVGRSSARALQPKDTTGVVWRKGLRIMGPIFLSIGIISLLIGFIGRVGGGTWHVTVP